MLFHKAMVRSETHQFFIYCLRATMHNDLKYGCEHHMFCPFTYFEWEMQPTVIHARNYVRIIFIVLSVRQAWQLMRNFHSISLQHERAHELKVRQLAHLREKHNATHKNKAAWSHSKMFTVPHLQFFKACCNARSVHTMHCLAYYATRAFSRRDFHSLRPLQIGHSASLKTAT